MTPYVLRSRWLLFALALALSHVGCKKSPLGSTDAASVDGGIAASPTFVCGGTEIACTMDVVPSVEALPQAIRDRVRTGKIAEANALVACAKKRGDALRLEADPGLEHVQLTSGNDLLIAPLDEDAIRVFDTKSATETMRIPDARTARFLSRTVKNPTPLDNASLLGGDWLLVPGARERAPHGRAMAATSKLWNVTEARSLDVARILPGTTVVGASDNGRYLWGIDGSALAITTAEEWKTGGAPQRLVADHALGPSIEVVELEGSRVLVSDRNRHAIFDTKTGEKGRAFGSRGRLSFVGKNVAVFEDGSFLQGFDDPVFDPEKASEIIPLDGAAPAARLTAPACPRSMVLALSPNGALALSASREKLCLFDMASRRLLGTLGSGESYAMRIPQATFVGAELAIAGVSTHSGRGLRSDGGLHRIKVDPSASSPLVDLGAIPSSVEILDPQPQRNQVGRVTETRAFVAARDSENGLSRIHEVKADGTTSDREVKTSFSDHPVGLGLDLMSGTVLPSEGPNIAPLVVGPTNGLGGVVACPVTGVKPCVDLPLGGTPHASPDGKLIVGPPKRGKARFTSPAFSYGQRGTIAFVDPKTGQAREHDAPGFRSATFGSAGELLLFGDDGALLSCAVDTGVCTLAGRFPSAVSFPASPGAIATFDTELRINGEPRKVAVTEKLADEAKHLETGGPSQDVVVSATGPSLIRGGSDGLELHRLDGSKSIITPQRCIVAVDGAGERVACLGSDGLRVFGLADTSIVYEQKWKSTLYDPFGAVALTSDGLHAGYVTQTTFAIADIATKKVVAKMPLESFRARVVAIAPDGKTAVTAMSTERNGVTEAQIAVLGVSGAVERINVPLTSRRSGDPLSLALDAHGNILARWLDGGVVYIDKSRRIFTLVRSGAEDGVWLTLGGRARGLGNVRARTQALACRVGVASIVPAEACLPLLCDAALTR